jgi:hypothetical protein
MDEDDDKDFSKSIVFGFLDQAETTFTKMDAEKYTLPASTWATMTDRPTPETQRI